MSSEVVVPVVSARRDEILAIAAGLFAEQGFATTTVREIADAAGILSGSLYHHFDSKESMVDDLLRGFLDDILARYRAVAGGDDPVGALRALVRTGFEAVDAHRSAVAVMLNEYNLLVQYPRFAFLRDAAEETERIWVEVLERGIQTGVLRADVEASMVYRFMRDAIWVSVRWYRPDRRYRPNEIADFYLATLLEGIAQSS